MPTFKILDDVDVPLVAHMREQVLGWDHRRDYVTRAITDGHAVGAYDTGGLIGFRYQHRLAPDVLGDGLLLVHPAWRGTGVGRKLVETFEHSAPDQFRLSVVLNTNLLDSATVKGDATSFWQMCGYELVAETHATRLLVRHYPHRAPARAG